jgi:hypothetical protein
MQAVAALPVGATVKYWRFGPRGFCKPCKIAKNRCGSRKPCKTLSRIYWEISELRGLLAWEEPRDDSSGVCEIKWLDFKFLFLLAIAVNPRFQIMADSGEATLAAFPYKVDPAKKREWLKMVRDVEKDPEVQERNPRLDARVTTRVGGGDPFLDWIMEQMANHEATFHSRLSECLIPKDAGVGLGVQVA